MQYWQQLINFGIFDVEVDESGWVLCLSWWGLFGGEGSWSNWVDESYSVYCKVLCERLKILS